MGRGLNWCKHPHLYMWIIHCLTNNLCAFSKVPKMNGISYKEQPVIAKLLWHPQWSCHLDVYIWVQQFWIFLFETNSSFITGRYTLGGRDNCLELVLTVLKLALPVSILPGLCESFDMSVLYSVGIFFGHSCQDSGLNLDSVLRGQFWSRDW